MKTLQQENSNLHTHGSDQSFIFLKEIEEEREVLMRKIGELSAERASFIEQKLEEETEGDSFDEVVQRFIEVQAADKGIHYR